MSTSFNATARINLDIKSFAQGAQAVTRSGGQMSQIFQNLNQSLSRVALVEGQLAAKLRTTLSIYNQAASTVKSYASAVAQLQKNEQAGANGAKSMTSAFTQLRAALGQVQGMSEKEYQRLSRTLALYERMANAVKSLAAAQKSMSSVTQNAIVAQQKDEQAKQKAAETARRLSLEEQKLAARRQELAQSAARMAAEESRVAANRQRLAQATSAASQSQVAMSGSSFSLRNSIGELEQSFQALFNVVTKVPTAMASAAISQEAAFAQVSRVVGESQAEAAGLLQEFQKIAQQAPISFEEVANIGKLGGQIGISASALGEFTNTVVKFSLTTGVASEEATLLLGRIAQMQDVPISEMEQLGSAILYLGTQSAATEQEILRINASIATVSNLFGLTTQETAGLSAALATLNVRPELSRGALTRVFNDLSLAVSNGGTELAKLAKVMGMTGAETTKLFKTDPGAFFLAFVNGLSGAAGAGGEVQGVLRELGINAVRDIDVFSRLANNADLVRASFDDANVSFARGSELTRQSKSIYETTSAELQNLSDAFKTLLATLGGPFATAIGGIASGLSGVVEWLSKLGPIVPIFGTIAALATAGAAGWLIYQVALAKTISALIATEELQNKLKVSSLNAKLAVDIHRKGLAALTMQQQEVNIGAAQTVARLGQFQTATLRSAASARALATANGTAATSMGAMGAASGLAARNQLAMFTATSGAQGALQRLNTSGSANALAMASVSQANRAVALTSTQVAGASRVYAGQMALAATSVQGLNTSTVRAVPVLSGMSSNMQRAATSGASLGAGLRTTSNASIVASRAFTNTAAAAASTGLAARAASFAFGPWGLALGTMAIVLGPMIGQLFDLRSNADRLAASAMNATGGTQALANAIRADTEAAAAGATPFRTLTLAKSDMSAADRRTAESARDSAEQQNQAIQMTKGSVDQLKAQAQGHGAGAEAAARYVRQIEKNKKTISETTQALGENTAAIGVNTQQWLLDTAQAVVEQSHLADGSKDSMEALKQLSATGLNVGGVLQKSMTDPKAAVKELDAAIKAADATARVTGDSDPFVPYSEGATEASNGAKRLRDFLLALRTVISSEDSAANKSLLTKKLLADALDDTAQSANSASGRIKITRESLEDLDSTAEEVQNSIDELAGAFGKFGTPLDAFKKAAENSFKGAKDAMDKFKLSSKGGLDEYIRQLEKIAKAQRDWSANLIKISTTLGPDIAEQFRKMGPEAAPAVAQLADLSAAELARLGPRLAEIGGDATSDLAASIIQNSGKVKNASLQTKTVIADVFGNMIDKAKTSKDFTDVSNQYAKLVTQLSKLKGVKVNISADDAKAFKSLNDLSLYIDLISGKKIKPSVAIDIIKAQGDIGKLQAIIKAAEASGSLDPKGRAKLDKLLFQTQLTELTGFVGALKDGKKLDADGHAKLSDGEYRAKVLRLTEFLASSEGQGLLNPKGKAQLNDAGYRAQMQALAQLILGKEAAGEFDANGDGKLSTGEFQRLLKALKDAVADANRGKLSPKGTVTLANVGGFNSQLGGIVRAAQSAGGRISQALNRTATVNVGYYYYKKNNPPKVGAAATGGWINGPGGPTSDSIPMMLSNGEYVVNAAAARRFGALLEVINRSGGRGFDGVARQLYDASANGGAKPVKIRQGGGGTTMLGESMVQQAAPEPVAATAARMAVPQAGPTTIFNINNQYPQAEPTSTTVNRSLAYAASIGGV